MHALTGRKSSVFNLERDNERIPRMDPPFAKQLSGASRRYWECPVATQSPRSLLRFQDRPADGRGRRFIVLFLPCGVQFPDVSSRDRETVGCYSRGEIDEGTGVTGRLGEPVGRGPQRLSRESDIAVSLPRHDSHDDLWPVCRTERRSNVDFDLEHLPLCRGICPRQRLSSSLSTRYSTFSILKTGNAAWSNRRCVTTEFLWQPSSMHRPGWEAVPQTVEGG